MDKTLSLIKRAKLEAFGEPQLELERSKQDSKGYAAALAAKPPISTTTFNNKTKAKDIGSSESDEGIGGLIHKFSNFNKLLQVTNFCFEAIIRMSKGLKREEIKKDY